MVILVNFSVFSMSCKDSTDLVQSVKMRKFKIEKIVFEDCISQLLKVKDTGKYDKTEVERKRNKVFDKFFIKVFHKKSFVYPKKLLIIKSFTKFLFA